MPRVNSARHRRTRSVPDDGYLPELAAAFDNPGAVTMRCFVPEGLPPRAPLVVVLHGCTQSAAAYDHGSGWTSLAAAHGFAVLFPEQARANNPNLCFKWFEAADTRRGGGEAASIANAVAAMMAEYRLDPARVFVTGLSAGGAMTAVMLATYPDVFAGGAIIAGLPFGAAHGVPEAMQAMANPTAATPRLLGDRVRAASAFDGPWPIVSVWHGDADRTVNCRNGEAVAEQWANVHGAAHDDNVWRTPAGVAVVELVKVEGMGHGTPIDAGRDGSHAAPFMLDVGIGSSARIAAFWGLAVARSEPVRLRPRAAAHSSAPAATRDFGRLITETLRSVGLMK